MIIKQINNFQKFLSILLIFSTFLVFSCSTNDSITGDNKISRLEKPSEIEDFFSPKPPINEWTLSYPNLAKLLLLIDTAEKGELCVFFIYGKVFTPPENIEGDEESLSLSELYNFRDNYLLNSQKGQLYTASYYILSEYGIENNLVMKYSMEHLSLMNTGIAVSRELQHGTNDSKILINKSTYDDLKNIVKIYRDSENHTDIEPILNYLETDLEKYYNKTKAEIAVDFEQN